MDLRPLEVIMIWSYYPSFYGMHVRVGLREADTVPCFQGAYSKKAIGISGCMPIAFVSFARSCLVGVVLTIAILAAFRLAARPVFMPQTQTELQRALRLKILTYRNPALSYGGCFEDPCLESSTDTQPNTSKPSAHAELCPQPAVSPEASQHIRVLPRPPF